MSEERSTQRKEEDWDKLYQQCRNLLQQKRAHGGSFSSKDVMMIMSNAVSRMVISHYCVVVVWRGSADQRH